MRLLRIALTVIAMCLAGPASAQWFRAESPHFIVYGERDPAILRMHTAELEDFHDLMRLLTGAADLPDAPKLAVYLVRGTGQLRIVWPGVRSAVAGFYSAGTNGVLAVADMGARVGEPGEVGSAGARTVLFHEYAHHFMYQYFPGTYPPWYVEGFAEFMSGTRFIDGMIEYGGLVPGRGLWLTQSDEWLDMGRMLFDPLNADAGRFYAQSWITVHYLFRDPARRAALNTYLSAFGRGEDPRRAFEAAFGITPARFEADVRRYALGRGGIPVTRLRRTSAQRPPAIRVTALSPAASPLLLQEAALRMVREPPVAQALLRQTRSAAGRFPEDPFARRVLARAEALFGDGGAADRLLGPLMAAAPADADLMFLNGVRHLRANSPEGRREGLRWLARAYRADPRHFQALHLYARTKLSEPEGTSDNNVNILMLARQIAPQVDEITLDLAYVLMHRDRFDEAILLLAPLTSDFHSQVKDRAVEWLALARARERPAVPQPDREPSSSLPPRG